ncbi:tripartite tricarboxylate transporter substrate binding protein [Cupriavidus sp. BIS7]|uniref:Bug family tripartite tricarboxylate transporter substrate binding protein n=1 Tax=Cupriavidus sp. BIS7 TaxID=1217718 RepID=UPI00037321DE|nr:tripartite tricarboxylate transporter substrate binding protein [Cupriavidus sp. BIS7]
MMTNLLRHGVRLGMAMVLAAPLVGHCVEPYPTKPVRLLVGFAPGGSTDIIARLIAPKLSQSLGQQVIVDSRPGAGGAIAADIMVKSPPDGHTLLLCTTGLVSIQPFLQRMPFDPAEIVPVTLIGNTPYIALVNASLPVHNVKELVAYAKAHPGKLNFASSGNGTAGHLAGEMFKLRTGVDMVHVPYKGSGQAMADLLGGQVSLIFDQPVSSMPYVRSGKLRILGVAASRRLEALPNVPTFAEQGISSFEPVAWIGLCARKGTPASVLARLSRDTREALKQPAVAQHLSQDGIEVIGDSPEKFREFLVLDRQKWGGVIKDAKVSAN